MPDLAAPTDQTPYTPTTERSGNVSPDNKNTRDLRDTDIVSQILRYREEAWHRDYVVRDKWLQCYQLTRNHQDFTDKAPWQSRLTLAKAHAAVKQFVANIVRLLLSSQQWVTVEPGEPNQQLKVTAPMVESAVLNLCDTPAFRYELRDSLEFGGAIGVGALRVDWSYGERNDLYTELGRDGSTTPVSGNNFSIGQRQRKEGYIKFSSVDPFHLWWGPRTKMGREFDWIMEESYADIASLKSVGAGFDNIDKIWGDTPDQSAITRSYEQQRKDKRIAPETTRKQIHLLEYWGDLVDTRTNEVTAKNRHIVIANRTTIIKNEDNPYWDRKPPYILYSPLIVAGRWPGQGIIEIALPILNEINFVAQKMSDHLSFSVVPMLEVEASALENPEGDIQTGIQPGKVFYRRASAGMQAVQGVQMPQLGNASFNFELMLGKETERSTFITETVQGLTDAKGETTATEIQTSTQFASALIADIAQYIEDGLLSPIAECVWSRAFQFIDSTSRPTWSELVGPEIGELLDKMPRDVRTRIIQGRYNFKAHGLSRAIQRQQNIQRYEQFLQVAATMAPQLMPLIHMPTFLQRIFEGYHFPNPAELMPENIEETFQAMQKSMVEGQNPAFQEQVRAQGKQAITASSGDQQGMLQLLQAALQKIPGGAGNGSGTGQ